MKRGYATVIDSMVAISFTLIVLASLAGVDYSGGAELQKMTVKRLHYVSEDTLDTLNKNGVLDLVGEGWAAASGNTSSPEFLNVSEVARQNLDVILPESMGYSLMVDGDIIVNNTRVAPESSTALTHSTRLLVGYGRGLPTRGFVARAFLTNIKEKTSSSYVYFGGFVGQGNVTIYMRDVPWDATVQRCCLELNSPSPFDLYINDGFAGSYTPSGGTMSANLKEGVAGNGNGCVQAAYLPLLTPGLDNKFELRFTGGAIDDQYVGGGFVRALYNTSEMDTSEAVKKMRYYLPFVVGIIDVRDSFYVPGTVTAMSMSVDFLSNHSTYLNIGDITVFRVNGSESPRNIAFTTGDMGSMGFIYQPVEDSKSISQKTVPVRIAANNSGGASGTSALYPTSYIEFEFTPLNESMYGEVSVTRATDAFEDTENCSGVLVVPGSVVISSAKATSYSGQHWTDRMQVTNDEGTNIGYILGSWGADYSNLGDPFAVEIPAKDIISGANNTVEIWTGDNPSSPTSCSEDNRIIYIMRMRTLVNYGGVFPESNGCNWEIEFEDGSTYSTPIPVGYAGTNQCKYTNAERSYYGEDAIADSVYRLLDQLDLDDDGMVDLLFDPDMIDFELSQAGGVKSLWGPAMFKLILWM